MTLDVSALGSISATLDDLTIRIGQIVDGANSEDEIVLELKEVERQLQSSTRRLAKAVRRAN